MKKSNLVFTVLLIFCLVSPATLVWAVEDSWIVMKPLPNAISWLEVAVVNGKIYAIGGSGGYGSTSVNEYDPITDTWTTKTPMPTPRTLFGMAVVENKIYTIGGDRGNSELGEVLTSINEVYDPLTDKWTTLEPIPTPVNYHTSAVVDNKIYIMDGIIEDTLNQIYDTETDTWSTGAPLPTGVDSAAAGVTTGTFATKRIYVIGGKQNLDAVKLNQVYDPETDTWINGQSMPTARYGLGVAVLNDTVYAIGGREGWIGFPVSAANEKYTPAGYVPEFPSLTILISGLSAVLVLSIIYRRGYKNGRKI